MNRINILVSIISIINFMGCSQDKLFDSSFSTSIAVGNGPSKVSIADVNNDSFNDIIVTTDKGLMVLLNDGKGNFTPAKGTPFPAGYGPADIGQGDFNNDGNIDFAIPNHERDEVTILLGNGEGVFQQAPYSHLTIDFNPHAHSVATGDINNDGNTDLILTNFLGAEIITITGDGKGYFPGKPIHISVPHYPYRNVIFVDINSDGNNDIVTPANNSNAVTVLYGNGKGAFQPANGSPFPIGDNPFFVIAGDFNGDKLIDIAATNFDTGSLSVLPDNKSNDLNNSVIKSFKVGEKPVCLAKTDFNKDGITDLVCANYQSNNISILLGDRNQMFYPDIQRINVGKSPYGVAIGDLNGDSNPDIVTANFEDASITLLFNLKKD